MIAPAEAITIVDVRTEEDILEVLNDLDQLLAQNTLLLTSLILCEKLDSSCRCVIECHYFLVKIPSFKICRLNAGTKASRHAAFNSRYHNMSLHTYVVCLLDTH